MDGTTLRDCGTTHHAAIGGDAKDGEAVHTNAMDCDAGDIVTWFNRLIRWHPDVLREASEQYERQILHNIQTILGHGDSQSTNANTDPNSLQHLMKGKQKDVSKDSHSRRMAASHGIAESDHHGDR
ncbi:MAG: hypothetical protein PHE53_14305 [Thermoguttaceae bacterium]|nr:hypothetical protein [Thermoguttaceae bacterium]